ncbi:hypothetical protein OB03_09940 [Brevundimonas sp. GN22]
MEEGIVCDMPSGCLQAQRRIGQPIRLIQQMPGRRPSHQRGELRQVSEQIGQVMGKAGGSHDIVSEIHDRHRC